MEITTNFNILKIEIDSDDLARLNEVEDINSDDNLYDFFEDTLVNCEYDWILPEEIGALTDAPILGMKDSEGNVIEAYGFMEYQLISLLESLKKNGFAILEKG